MKWKGSKAGREREKWIRRRKMAPNILVNLVMNTTKISSDISESRRHCTIE